MENYTLMISEERKTGEPGEKHLGARERTNKKTQPACGATPGLEPRPHWWRRVFSPLRHPLLPTPAPLVNQRNSLQTSS